MWARNLLFLGLILGGISALSATLFPREVPPRVKGFDPQAFRSADFRSIVDKVNASFRQQWTELGVQPAPPAPELTVARRLSLGLAGTIPSLQEIRQLQVYPGDERVQWWLAGILQDPRYGDYVAERLARAFVSTEDGPFIVFRRRRFVSWLSGELMRNASYDEIVRQLIAADGLWTDKPATNFVSVTIDPNDKKAPDPERLAARVARAFLGIRLDCAQCHDHPFAKWVQKDFQGLAAFFGQTKYGFTGIYDGDGEFQVEERKTGTKRDIEPRVPFLPELVPSEGSRRQQLAGWVTDPHNPFLSRATVNRAWALLFGQPLVEPVDDLMKAESPSLVLDLLAEDFVAHQFDLRRLFQVIAAAEVFQLDSAAEHEISEAHKVAWAAFPLTPLRPEQVVGSLLQAGTVETINRDSHIFTRLLRTFRENDFVRRYGDTGDDEFSSRSSTIPQRLLMMNGNITLDKTKGDLFNASTRIGWMAADDRSAVMTAYLAVFSRLPDADEAAHFESRLAGSTGDERSQRMEDLYWTLVNGSEFSCNH